jgi:hypothetical protein
VKAKMTATTSAAINEIKPFFFMVSSPVLKVG